MRRKTLILVVILWGALFQITAQSNREHILIDEGWRFAFGHAADPLSDFKTGTEYFNYLTKANSIHNEGPYALKFDATGWRQIDLPHDWVVDLPYDSLASHSHGYKTVGYQYPSKSVGWYRKSFFLPEMDLGKHIELQFDGIFRDARIWVNGFYVGNEPSGYVTQVYDVTDYLNYGGDNLITVRIDATLEEGWYYEGAGIYRHVWLNKMAPMHVQTFGTFVSCKLDELFEQAAIKVETTVENAGLERATYRLCQVLQDAEGREIVRNEVEGTQLLPKERGNTVQQMVVHNPHLWDVNTPYLYTLSTEVYQGDQLVDLYTTMTGIRHIRFDAEKGFFLNGKSLKLKGVNMHQDHPGVGTGIPDALQTYRLRQLKKLGCNAYRSSHHPMTPEMLEACDREGLLVIEENRLMGINQAHIGLLERMIVRDRNHPSIILWSVGNEEWGIEGNISGQRIAASMREYCHRIDPTRLVTAALSGGNELLKSLDVIGYNYIMQNPVEQYHQEHPHWIALGSEETSGTGTRGVYVDDKTKGHLVAFNRNENNEVTNVIERGWKFYAERPYLGGLFYWTGFDYRGEPNPLKFPATGSQYGILDYCGFPKDEAYYLKAWWTNEPVLHLFPHWNWQGQEGAPVDLWVYSNCEEVELFINGKSLERKKMTRNGHLSWQALYQPGSVKAIGYKKGKRVLEQKIETTGAPAQLALSTDRTNLQADNQDVAVFKIEMQDQKGRFVSTACNQVTITIEGPARILGVGNGDPAYQDSERPSVVDTRSYTVKLFNGLAQVLFQSTYKAGIVAVTAQTEGVKPAVYKVTIQQVLQGKNENLKRTTN